MSPARKPLDVAFWSKVHMTDGCWLWTAMLSDDGYGRIAVRRRQRYAHRVAYEQMVGPIPEGMELDHLCRNRRCVRPDHLEPVTHLENIRRAQTGRCRRGHPLAGANLYVDPKGRRVCKQCRRVADLRRHYRDYERRNALSRARHRRIARARKERRLA
jgi:hypothetical protein